MGFLAELGLSAPAVSAVFVLIFLVNCIFVFLCAAFFYIKAVAIFKIANKKEIKNSWFAFVPFSNLVVSGKIANLSSAKKCGKKAHFEKALIAQAVMVWVLVIASVIMLTVSFVNIIFAADAAMAQNVDMGAVLSFPIIESRWLLIATAAMMLIFKIQKTVVLKNILNLYCVKATVILAVLAFIIPVLSPLFLISLCKED